MGGLADWVEAKHPRDPDGKFASGDGEVFDKREPVAKSLGGSLTSAMFRPAVEDKFKDGEIYGNIDRDGLKNLLPGLPKHEGLAKWLSKPENRPTVRVLHGIPPGTRQDVDGAYTPYDKSIWINGDAKIAQHANLDPKFGEWNKVWNISTKEGRDHLGSNKEYVQGDFLHELGHHIGMSDGDRHAADMDRIITSAYNKFDLDKVVPTPARDMYGEAKPSDAPEKMSKRDMVLGRILPSPTLTAYGASSKNEYFAESFAAYMMHKRDLQKHDPTGFKMVRDVLVKRGIET